MKNQFLEAGVIVGTHGIRGEMKVEPWMDSPEALKAFKKLYLEEGKKDIKLKSSRVHKSMLLITCDGINDATTADTMRGKTIYIDRNDAKLPKGKFFISDLIGLTVKDGNTAEVYGTIEEVIQAPANDVYRIKNGEKEFYFPAVKQMIKTTNIDEGYVEVLPIPGIFDDNSVEDR